MIFITGDTHGQFTRIANGHWPQAKKLTKDDYLIVVGDFGRPWDGYNCKDDNYWLDWLNDRPFTVLFVDGNHENFDLLNNYPIKEWRGGKVHIVRENVLHLMRGELYNIPVSNGVEKTFFCFGGAESIDKDWRIPRISWWEEELPSYDECNYGLDKLASVDNVVDYIITHDCPDYILTQVNPRYNSSGATRFLEEIRIVATFDKWFFGHHHINREFEHGKFICLYDDIVQLT